MVQIEVEILLSVSDYLANLRRGLDGRLTMPGYDEAFRLASSDTAGALSAAIETAYYELDADVAAAVKAISASYLETDSSNPTHASAHYRVLLDVPDELADKVRQAFCVDSDENNSSPHPGP